MSSAELLVDDPFHVIIKLSINLGLGLFANLLIAVQFTVVDGLFIIVVLAILTVRILLTFP